VSGSEDITLDELRDQLDDECARFEPLLAAHALGEDGHDPHAASDRRALDTHLASCTSCREVEDALGSMLDGLSGAMLGGSPPAPARPSSRVDAVAEKVAPERSGWTPRLLRRLLPVATFVAGAGIATLIALFTTGARGAHVLGDVWSAPAIPSIPVEARPAASSTSAPSAATQDHTNTPPPPPKAPDSAVTNGPPPIPPQQPYRNLGGWTMPPIPGRH
jgi:hypothetical protein